jgi:16S rRNA processing protein RimM
VLNAGRVGRPHGLDGFFHVVDGAPQLLTVGTPLRIAGREAEIVARKGLEEKPVIKLSIADDRSAAVALRGEMLLVAREAAPELEEDEYWAEDLIGCSVYAGDKLIGKVKRLLAMPSVEVLELDGGMMVPMVHDALASVDIEAKRIEVVEGFIDAG